jgi:CBS domain-containing protein
MADVTIEIRENETPVEIVAHEMITKHSQRAYVVKDDKLLGIIYRKDIVRKVLYL